MCCRRCQLSPRRPPPAECAPHHGDVARESSLKSASKREDTQLGGSELRQRSCLTGMAARQIFRRPPPTNTIGAKLRAETEITKGS